jgi:aerobic C4-dicarboxylate transport protein
MTASSATTRGEARNGQAIGARRSPWYKHLYFWVLVGIGLGILVGAVAPKVGVGLQPVGDSFVSLIKMVITPVIFCTVVVGIASVDSLRRVGRIGIKTIGYFELVTTAALALGLIVMNVLKPGAGVHAKPSHIKVADAVSGFIAQGHHQHWYDPIVNAIPNSVVGAFSTGNVLQVLVFAILFGLALNQMGPVGKTVVGAVDTVGKAIFGVVRLVMYLAPIGAGAAMAFTVGKYGIHTLEDLAKLVAIFYGTAIVFVVGVLGAIARANGIGIFKLLRYLKDELLVVLGTSSSEAVLPQLMRKLENLGCARDVVGLTVPTGYSFNLDGTCIYLTLAALYIAQAQDINLSLASQLGLLAVLLITSKGAAGVTGSGFIVLAATLSTVGTIPVAGIMLVFGIDKFMSECRALTNLVGNSVASIVIARSEGQFDEERARRVLGGDEPADDLDVLLPDVTLPAGFGQPQPALASAGANR